MTKVIETKTVESVTGFRADDGTFFPVRNNDASTAMIECDKYECTAKGIVGADYSKLIVKTTTQGELFNFGDWDCDIDILLPKSSKDIMTIRMYTNMIDKDCHFSLDDEAINKSVLVMWNYDKDIICDITTLDAFIKKVGDRIEQFINKT